MRREAIVTRGRRRLAKSRRVMSHADVLLDKPPIGALSSFSHITLQLVTNKRDKQANPDLRVCQQWRFRLSRKILESKTIGKVKG